jgi:MerR family transcriptional regulator, copper efflux regulator
VGACPGCGRSHGPVAPSGRCLECEAKTSSTNRAPIGALRQIGEVAATVGLSLRTVRFYEEAGLVIPVARTVGGFRLYNDESIERLRLIMKMKPLGFTLDEMRVLIELVEDVGARAAEDPQLPTLLDRLAMFADAADARVADLEAMLDTARSFAETLRRGVERTSDSSERSARPRRR